jgi:hypothetical protein
MVISWIPFGLKMSVSAFGVWRMSLSEMRPAERVEARWLGSLERHHAMDP